MNNDDFDSDDFELDDFDSDFNDLDGGNKGTLGDLWRNNPFVKIGTIILVIALFVGIIILLGGDKEKEQFSRAGKTSDVTETPGSAEVSETYKQAIEEGNTKRLEEALRQNESAVPMPVEAPKGVIPLTRNDKQEEDPLDRWRRLQKEKVTRASKMAPETVNTEPEVDTKTPAIQALSEAMSAQMDGVLKNQKIKGSQNLSVADIEYLEGLQQKADEKREKELERRREQTGGDESIDRGEDGDILLPAGTIEYAQLLIEANTDVPGPILAEIMTGPFKGGRLIGNFTETYNYLTLSFNTIVLEGIDYSADAVALDPDTTLPGLATDINRRYFTRVVLPVAAEFITGFAEAVGNSGNTTVTISGADSISQSTSNNRDDDQEVALGIARAGTELGGIINEIKDNYPQQIRVRAGTAIGVLFVDAVENDEDEDITGPYERLQTGIGINDNEANNAGGTNNINTGGASGILGN